jgi:thermitase
MLHLLLVILFLLPPCLICADGPKPTTPLSSPPKSGGKEGACGVTGFKAGEIIAKFEKDIPLANLRSLLLAEGMSIQDELDGLGFILLSVPKGQELEKAEELKRNPLVEYAQPNCMVKIAEPIATESHSNLQASDVTPNDPYFLSLSQWNLTKVKAPAAWDITTGNDRVVIAVVDSGIDLNHPDLKDKVWKNPKEIPDNGLDDDRNGYVDDVQGWDFVNWDGKPQDDYGHGTFVASIAAAATNNGIGMAGVSWGAEIMPVKVIDEQGYSRHWHTAGGIKYAADNGAKIINLSWSLYSDIDPEPLQAAINYAYSKGVFVVAAAGDSYDGSYQYPAALEHVVSVAATDRDDGHPDFSTYNDRVDVAAPGVAILGLCLGGVYCRLSSTHAAAPHVAGLAALIWSVNPTLTPDEVESLIEATAVDLGESGWDEKFGHGRIDASAAVMATAHYLEVEPDEGFYFLVCDSSIPALHKIINPNTNAGTWSVTPGAPWLSISRPEGYTPSSARVSINKNGLPGYGLHTAAITVTSTLTNSVNNPLTIPITVTYPPQCWRNCLPLLFKTFH